MSIFLVAVRSDSIVGARREKAKVLTRCDEIFLRCKFFQTILARMMGRCEGVKDEADAEKNLGLISKQSA